MAASSGIILPAQTAALTTTPASGGMTLYQDSTYAQPKWKDASGNSHFFGVGIYLNVIDYGADPTGATDSTTAIQNAINAVPNPFNGTASVVLFPAGTYLVSGTLNVVSQYVVLQGAGNPQTTIISTSTTADLFTVNQWNLAIRDMYIVASATTWTSGTIASGTVTVGAITLAQWPTSGTISYGTSAGGWGTFSYTGRTTTTFTGTANVSGSGTMNAGAPIQLKTAGYAINISSGVNYNSIDNVNIQSFFNGVNQAGATNSMQNMQIRNSVNIAVNVNNTNAQVYMRYITTDNTATNQPVTANLQVLTCGLLQISDSDFIHGGAINASFAASGAGIFSVYIVNTFFDTSAGTQLSITGSVTMRSVKFVECWFSSGTTGIVLNNTAASGLDFIGCDVLTNSSTAVIITAVADVKFTGCRVASPSAGTQIGFTLAGSPVTTKVSLLGCTVGTVGAFFNFATGVSIAAGTYGAIRIVDCDLSTNTTPLTDSSTTVTTKIFKMSPGINPRVAVTPAVPASTVAVTNTTGVDVTAYIKAGTLSVITVGGTATGITAGSAGPAGSAYPIPLAANQTIAITYTVAPTWVWIGS